MFVPAVDRGDGIRLPLMMIFSFRPCGLLNRKFHQSGRTPMLPLYALLLFNAPDVLTLRTLYEFAAFGVICYKVYPKRFYALVLSRFFHAAVMYFTSSASFDQYSQLFIEIKPISCESSIKKRSSSQKVNALA